MNGPSQICRAQAVECPSCAARFVFRRSPAPPIDSCGFESYSLNCTECGVALAGIIDPCDETLLISAVGAGSSTVPLQYGEAAGRFFRVRSVG